jgi:hypothetical protein
VVLRQKPKQFEALLKHSTLSLFLEQIIVTHGTDTMIETARFLAAKKTLNTTRRIVLVSDYMCCYSSYCLVL